MWRAAGLLRRPTLAGFLVSCPDFLAHPLLPLPASRKMRGAKIPALPATEDFPEFLDIRERHLPPGPVRLDCPDQNAGPHSGAAVDADDVAGHASPTPVADRQVPAGSFLGIRR